MTTRKFPINRAPVLTLWAFVVAMRQGHDEESALTLGQALAALNAQSKGRRLGIYEAGEKESGSETSKKPAAAAVRLLGREVPIKKVGGGIRAAPGGEEIKPAAVRTYLEKKFGEHLGETRSAMESLAKSLTPTQLETRGFALYEKFRPQIPEGKKGWGAKGELDLDAIRRLAK
ncbi:MAG TPA: hypothetical protein VFH29_00635 [Anaerolineales bacterium]|nr:hypothetical protein [Anaerolineales bacterium]